MYLSSIWPNPWKPSIAFAGPRSGMNMRQWMVLNWLLHMLEPEIIRHGDCVGSDAELSWLVHSYLTQCELHVHPCDLPQYQAKTTGHHHYPAAPPLVRNRHMVDNTDITIATPFEDEPVLRSGTWSTIRYSMGNNKPTIILHRSGRVSVYDGRKVLPMQATVLPFTAAAIAADTTGTTAIPVPVTTDGWFGMYASGTFGSGTLKLQASAEDSGSTWVDVPSVSFTAAGYKHFQVFARRLRLVLSGSTAPSITAKLAAATLSGVTRTDS